VSPPRSPSTTIRPNLLYGAASPDRLTLSPGWEEEAVLDDDYNIMSSLVVKEEANVDDDHMQVEIMKTKITRAAPDTDLAGYPLRPYTGYPAGFSGQNLNVFQNIYLFFIKPDFKKSFLFKTYEIF
jgi:hypothetical protein